MLKRKLTIILRFFEYRCRIPKTTEISVLLLLILLGLAGNHFNLEMHFGVNFLFGSVATMIAIRMSGVLWGTLVGVLVGSYTYYLWGHPFAVIIFGLEALFVAITLELVKYKSMILADVIYWVVIGIPMVWLCYHIGLGLDAMPVVLIMLKQTANGIVNCIVADLLLFFRPSHEKVFSNAGFRSENKWPMHLAISSMMSAFVIFPTLILMIVSGQDEFGQIKRDMKVLTSEKARVSARELSAVLEGYSEKLTALASLELNDKSYKQMEQTIEHLKKYLTPHLINMKIVSQDEKVLFSYPESGVSKPEYEIHFAGKSDKVDVLSKIHKSKNLSQQYFSMKRTINDKFFLVATISLDVFKTTIDRLSKEGNYVGIWIDEESHVLSSDENFYRQLMRGENPEILLPIIQTDLSSMARWRAGFWEESWQINKASDWEVRVAIPILKSIQHHQYHYIQILLVILSLSILSLFLVSFLIRFVSKPLVILTNAVNSFAKDMDQVNVIWPKSIIWEISQLVHHFQSFINTIYRKQKELTESEISFQNFIDNANAVIFSTDLDFCVIDWNRKAEQFTGYNKDYAYGKNLLAQFITDECKEIVQKLFDDSLMGKQTDSQEVLLVAKGGNRIDGLLNVTTRRNSSGDIVGAFGVVQDISALKNSQAQVIQASKLATLGEMATSVAHELNQPLNVIRMAAGNCRRKLERGTADNQYLGDKLNRIEEQTARATSIIDHMGIFGRKAKEEPEMVDPRVVVDNALDLMGEQLKLAGIKIVKQFSDECGHILAHAIQMEQVLLNLLSNSKDALHGKGDASKIILRVFENEDRINITLEDNGNGIPDKIIDRIFDPFYTTKEKGIGTGLGLSVSYGIITEMGGTISAENTQSGAKFSIVLPVAS